jgi:hypothetical protein
MAMRKFILKTVLYIFLILLIVEVIVRALHLYTEDPPRFIDEYGVEKRVPNNTGYAVTGNRNQNYSKFSINDAGFNSHRQFAPMAGKYEIAIVGDSFIEGFHQDYYNSIGKKIEDKLKNVEVYEYGYAGYDLANQMHLVSAYKEDFDKIDEIILYLNYESDLERGVYEPNYDRIKMLKSTPFKIRDNIKILAYGSKIGVLEPLKRLVTGKSFEEPNKGYKTNEVEGISMEEQKVIDLQRIQNFKSLINLYGFDKTKTSLLLDSRKTSQAFLEFCKGNDIHYIDFAQEFKNSKRSTILIYDWHWNNHGRELIAKVIASYIQAKREDSSLE